MPVSVQTRNTLILMGVLLAALPFGRGALASAALGGVIQIVNLRALERSVRGMLALARHGQARGFRALLALRLVLVLGVVAVVLLTQPVVPLAFTAGLSTVVPAVLWHGLRTAHQEV
ncbi:MAG: ATP synthase subunit I [Myxococcota bacterium]